MDLNKKRNYKIFTLSSQVKVFLDQEPKECQEDFELTGLRGETVSFQLAYTSDYPMRQMARIRIKSQIKDYIKIRTVDHVPVSRAINGQVDDNYLKIGPGLYPDLLQDLNCNYVKIRSNLWSSLWIDVEIPEDGMTGDFSIEIEFIGTEKENKDQVLLSSDVNLRIYDALLPQQEIIHTEWFYVDCLADYYKLEVFSEEHWAILEKFIHNYSKRGFNMILTPIFTYALDTEIGYERTTSQLIDIQVKNGEYTFSFDKLKRWIDLCKKEGIEYFEMSHLFSQWGAKHPPKIIASIDGNEEEIFGWAKPALGTYTDFLHAFIPALKDKLRKWEILDRTYFHVSDVPRKENIESYKAAWASLGDLFEDLKSIEAVSSYDFYQEGLVKTPVAATSVIHDFIDQGVEDLWAYYCTWQYLEVSNRFIAQPLARTRVLGVQLYKYRIKGFLHWGYNFYNSQLSLSKIDPYRSTDADDGFPAGDPFLVYPGPDGKPEESTRLMAIYQAFTDHRALTYLEKLTSREYVLNLIEEGLDEPIRFDSYPKQSSYLINLRNKINKEIDMHTK